MPENFGKERKTRLMLELSEKDFESSVGDGLVLVDFSAEWCGPCKAMLPTIKKISGEYDGRLRIFSVDIDKESSLAAKNGVLSVPTFILYRDGKAVDRLVGAVPEKVLKERIDSQLSA